MSIDPDDPIALSAQRAVQGIAELRADIARYSDHADQLEKANAVLQAELLMVRESLTAVTAHRDKILRFNIELVTQLNNVHGILTDVFDRAKHAEYVPENAITQTAQEEHLDPIPQFLGNGPREDQ